MLEEAIAAWRGVLGWPEWAWDDLRRAVREWRGDAAHNQYAVMVLEAMGAVTRPSSWGVEVVAAPPGPVEVVAAPDGLSVAPLVGEASAQECVAAFCGAIRELRRAQERADLMLAARLGQSVAARAGGGDVES